MAGPIIDLSKLSVADFGAESRVYNEKSTCLYAIAVGCGARDQQLVSEAHPRFAALPTLICASLVGATFLPPLADILPACDLRQLLHGEMYTQFLAPLPPSGVLVHTPQLISLVDKGNAAVVVTALHTANGKGTALAYTESTTIIRRTGRFSTTGAGPQRAPGATEAHPLPQRPPDLVAEERTGADQAVLYRLASDDYNPLHVDPEAAAAAGFERPILHGLATVGFAVRRLMQEFCSTSHGSAGGADGAATVDLQQLRSIKARLAGHVYPGEILVIQAWLRQQGSGRRQVVFRVKVRERGTVVLSQAALQLGPLPPQPSTAAAANSKL